MVVSQGKITGGTIGGECPNLGWRGEPRSLTWSGSRRPNPVINQTTTLILHGVDGGLFVLIDPTHDRHRLSLMGAANGTLSCRRISTEAQRALARSVLSYSCAERLRTSHKTSVNLLTSIHWYESEIRHVCSETLIHDRSSS